MGGDESYQLMAEAKRSIVAAALTGIAIARAVRQPLALDWLFVWKALAMLCIGATLLLKGLPEHHPFARLGVANHVTIARAVLVALLAGCIGEGASIPLQCTTLGVAAVAAALDALDGWSARRTNMTSSYGARFDMETDALLILVLSLLAWQFDKAGAWVLASGLLRYGFVTATLFIVWMQRPLLPSTRRKTIAAAQVTSLLIAIAPVVDSMTSRWLCAVTLAALAWSFLLDVTWLRRVFVSEVSVAAKVN